MDIQNLHQPFLGRKHHQLAGGSGQNDREFGQSDLSFSVKTTLLVKNNLVSRPKPIEVLRKEDVD